ncbi:hypothetical protein EZV62_023455 [Acer yangbiense]|uniref:Potassium channel n=1 Tax=Acer yangbiense TaxID=1000413 RepID=A0A5C7H245_9ROSI|nr:hypothetical protein EZV62_023455 [Acer yangbiense]
MKMNRERRRGGGGTGDSDNDDDNCFEEDEEDQQLRDDERLMYSPFFTPFEFGFFRGLPENLFLYDVANQIAFFIDIIVHFFVVYRDHHSYHLVYNPNLSILLTFCKLNLVVLFHVFVAAIASFDNFSFDFWIAKRIRISQKLYEPYIKEVLLFKGCSLGFIKQIATRVREEIFLPGEVVIEQGNVAEQLYTVCHGDLEEVGTGEDDEEKFLTHLHTCSSFGEVSFLCNTPQPYTIRGKDSNLQRKIEESDITLYIEKPESELATRLNCAANDGDFYRLKCLVGVGADPKKTDYDGRSPLHIAASKGYEDTIHFLIEKGMDVNISDKLGNTPLFEAIKNGDDRVASSLVKAGASLTIDNAGGFLCTTVARRELDLLKRVLANGINPNSKNYDY